MGGYQGRRNPGEGRHPLQHGRCSSASTTRLSPAPKLKVTLISPFVGRILDWYKKDTGKDYTGADDPGVQSVTTIYNYYKHFGYKTVVMGASFRNTGEITELAGCDLLNHRAQAARRTRSQQQGDLPRKPRPRQAAASMNIEKLTIDKATFDKMHAADRMASDKLEGRHRRLLSSKALEDPRGDAGEAPQAKSARSKTVGADTKHRNDVVILGQPESRYFVFWLNQGLRITSGDASTGSPLFQRSHRRLRPRSHGP